MLLNGYDKETPKGGKSIFSIPTLIKWPEFKCTV